MTSPSTTIVRFSRMSILALLMLSGTHLAHAADDRPSTERTEQARSAFLSGHQAWESDDRAEACQLFQLSQDLVSSPAALLNLGRCRESDDQQQQALDFYQQALRAVSHASNKEKAALWGAAAEEGIDRCEASIKAEARAEAEAEAEAQQRLEATETEQTRKSASPPASQMSSETSATHPPLQDATTAKNAPPQRKTPWILMGSGAGLILGSVIPGVVSLNANSTLNRECTLPTESGSDGCPADLESTQNRATTTAIVSDIMWITGAVVGAAGLTLWLVGSESKEGATALNVDCGLHGCNAALSGRF